VKTKDFHRRTFIKSITNQKQIKRTARRNPETRSPEALNPFTASPNTVSPKYYAPPNTFIRREGSAASGYSFIR
jgi:hypothetical protein